MLCVKLLSFIGGLWGYPGCFLFANCYSLYSRWHLRSRSSFFRTIQVYNFSYVFPMGSPRSSRFLPVSKVSRLPYRNILFRQNLCFPISSRLSFCVPSVLSYNVRVIRLFFVGRKGHLFLSVSSQSLERDFRFLVCMRATF